MPDSLMQRKNRFCLRPRVQAEALIRYALIKHSHAEDVPHDCESPRATACTTAPLRKRIDYGICIHSPARHSDLHRHEHQNRRNITHHFTLRDVQSIHPVAEHRILQAVLLR